MLKKLARSMPDLNAKNTSMSRPTKSTQKTLAAQATIITQFALSLSLSHTAVLHILLRAKPAFLKLKNRPAHCPALSQATMASRNQGGLPQKGRNTP
eukprot:6491193-Amphidinium_carterae.4